MTGYWIGRIKVTDPDAYAEYTKRVPGDPGAGGARSRGILANALRLSSPGRRALCGSRSAVSA